LETYKFSIWKWHSRNRHTLDTC